MLYPAFLWFATETNKRNMCVNGQAFYILRRRLNYLTIFGCRSNHLVHRGRVVDTKHDSLVILPHCIEANLITQSRAQLS